MRIWRRAEDSGSHPEMRRLSAPTENAINDTGLKGFRFVPSGHEKEEDCKKSQM